MRLRKIFRSRKDSLFYKTENGAEVGDLFMSLIHTCELNNVNPFDYLTELQKHAAELAKDPAVEMPWNYHQTPQQAGKSEEEQDVPCGRPLHVLASVSRGVECTAVASRKALFP